MKVFEKIVRHYIGKKLRVKNGGYIVYNYLYTQNDQGKVTVVFKCEDYPQIAHMRITQSNGEIITHFRLATHMDFLSENGAESICISDRSSRDEPMEFGYVITDQKVGENLSGGFIEMFLIRDLSAQSIQDMFLTEIPSILGEIHELFDFIHGDENR